MGRCYYKMFSIHHHFKHLNRDYPSFYITERKISLNIHIISGRNLVIVGLNKKIGKGRKFHQ